MASPRRWRHVLPTAGRAGQCDFPVRYADDFIVLVQWCAAACSGRTGGALADLTAATAWG